MCYRGPLSASSWLCYKNLSRCTVTWTSNFSSGCEFRVLYTFLSSLLSFCCTWCIEQYSGTITHTITQFFALCYWNSCCPAPRQNVAELPRTTQTVEQAYCSVSRAAGGIINGRQTKTHRICTEGSTSMGFGGRSFVITGRREQDNRLAGVSSISPSTRQCTALLFCTMKTPVGAHLIDR